MSDPTVAAAAPTIEQPPADVTVTTPPVNDPTVAVVAAPTAADVSGTDSSSAAPVAVDPVVPAPVDVVAPVAVDPSVAPVNDPTVAVVATPTVADVTGTDPSSPSVPAVEPTPSDTVATPVAAAPAAPTGAFAKGQAVAFDFASPYSDSGFETQYGMVVEEGSSGYSVAWFQGVSGFIPEGDLRAI